MGREPLFGRFQTVLRRSALHRLLLRPREDVRLSGMHTMNHSRTLSCTPEKGYHQGMDKTLRYYDENAAAFTADTVTSDMGAIQEAFIRQLHPGAHILDLGCGSGRDSKLFLSKGFAVTPVDGSAEMCTSAKANTQDLKCASCSSRTSTTMTTSMPSGPALPFSTSHRMTFHTSSHSYIGH